MSAALSGTLQAEKMGRVRVGKAAVTFSGTYALNGDTLDLTALAAAAGAANRVPFEVKIEGKAGFPYTFEPGTTPANGKIHAFTNTAGGVNAALTEHTNVAVVAGITGDTIRLTAWFSNKI